MPYIVAILASLLASACAQNISTSTVYQDVYAATTTVFDHCDNVCTKDAVTVSYTVVVATSATVLVGSGAPPGATAASSASSCGFKLAVNGQLALSQISDGQIQALGQIGDGQVQADSGLPASTFTISNGMVYDQAGRICSISGQDQSQFQCNYVPTTGSTTTTFSLSGQNLAFNGDTQFYACLLGGADDGYNIYQTLTGNQNGCAAITLMASGALDCPAVVTPGATTTPEIPVPAMPAATVDTLVTDATPVPATPAASIDTLVTDATPAPAAATPAASLTADVGVNTESALPAAAAPASSAADALPTVSAGLPASINGAASVSSKSVTALVIAAAAIALFST